MAAYKLYLMNTLKISSEAFLQQMVSKKMYFTLVYMLFITFFPFHNFCLLIFFSDHQILDYDFPDVIDLDNLFQDEEFSVISLY